MPLRSLLLLPLLLATCRGEEEEGRAALLLYKKMIPTSGFSANQPINISLTVFNKGPGSAYSLVVSDDNWKQDKFRIIAEANNFTLDYLNAGDSYEHVFTVKPIKKAWHRVRPAKMAFIDGVEGEHTIMHTSNSLPDIRIAAASNQMEKYLLYAGRFATLNVIQTKQGWMMAGGVIIFLLVRASAWRPLGARARIAPSCCLERAGEAPRGGCTNTRVPCGRQAYSSEPLVVS